MSQYGIEMQFAQAVARQVGPIMLEGYRSGAVVERKPDGTPVTLHDRKVQAAVASMVQAHRPGEPLLGEEQAQHTWGDAGTILPSRRWVCDPIDATWLYAAGVPGWLFSLALTEYGRPLLGVVYDPLLGRLVSAAVDTRAFLNGQPLAVNTVPQISGACLVLPGNKVKSLDAGRLFTSAVNQGADVVISGGSVNDALLVALGFAAAAVYPYSSPWDIAAIKPIVEACGGRVTDLRGQEQLYDRPIKGAIISNGHIHDKVVKLVRRCLS